MKIISIIPCKKHSERLPNKNVLPINNKELFKYSIEYSIENGIEPVVSTDSKGIMEYCIENKINYYWEHVDDSNMCNCIDQVLSKYDCDYFVLLQPTSPIRETNLLSKLKLPDTSLYSAEKVKLIGHIGNKFNICYKDQDSSSKFIYHFDGNFIIVNTKWYKKSHCLFNDESLYYIEDIPYSLQIDNKEQFEIIKLIIENDKRF